MNEGLALAQLHALVAVPGALKIITNEIRPELRADPADPASGLPPGVDDGVLKRPETFVLHDVTRVGEVDHHGCVRAWSAAGDWTYGEPSAVLARLQEWRG